MSFVRRWCMLFLFIEKTHDEQLKEEGAFLSTPEVQKIASQLGYEKEIITAAQKRFEKDINYIWPEAKKLVKRVFSRIMLYPPFRGG